MKNTTDLSTQEKKARVTSPRIKMNSNSKSKRLNHESDTEANALGRSERACGAHKKSSVWIHPMNLSNPQKLEPAPGLPVDLFKTATWAEMEG